MSATQRKRRTRSKRSIFIFILGVGVIFWIARSSLSLLIDDNTESVSTSNIRSSTVSIGNIVSTIHGSGTLAAENAIEVKVPEGIRIDNWYVSSGDSVVQDSVIATVDRNSILTTIAEAQRKLESIDSRITKLEDETSPTKLKSGVPGRVKLINAHVNDNIIDVMAAHGSLMMISLDGKMAVSIASDYSFTLWEEVNVILSSGKAKNGIVESINGQNAVVTVTDNGPMYGEAVTVTNKNDEEVGSGELYIHSPLAIVGYSGVVTSVRVKENEKVSADTTLIKLSDTGHTIEYQNLINQRQQIVEQLHSLNNLYQNGVITAPFDGIVQSIVSQETSSSTSSTSSAGIISRSTSISSCQHSNCSIVLLNQQEGNTSDAESTEDNTSEHWTQDGSSEVLTQQSPSEKPTQPIPVSVPISAHILLDGGNVGEYTGKFSLVLVSNNEVIQRKQNNSSGCVVFDDLAFSEVGDYVYSLSQCPGTDTQIIYDVQTEYTISISVALDEDGALNAFVSVLPESDKLLFSNSIAACEKPAEQPAQDPTEQNTQQPTEEPTAQSPSETPTQQTAPNITITLPEFSGYGNFSDGSDSSSETVSSDVSSDSDYSDDSTSSTTVISERAILTISPDDFMTVDANINELDILNIQIGQTAKVTIDAMGSEEITGTVIGVDSNGSVSSGTTQYKVRVRLEKNDRMLTNMGTNIEIIVSESSDCMTIPEAALYQNGAKTFVYTAFDQSTGELSGEREVTTGISDGTNVEICTGLSLGETVYYIYNEPMDLQDTDVF